MEFMKKFALIKNSLGLVVIGALFAAIGGMIVFSGNSDGSMMPLGFMALGIIVAIAGIVSTVKTLKTPAKSLNQYDRVDLSQIVATKEQLAERKNQDEEEFVFHYTGKGNQSYVMKDSHGEPVYEAICEKMTAVRDTEFTFRDHITGEESTKMVSHTITKTMDTGFFVGPIDISSTFGVNNQDVWDVIAADGYGFHFGLHGLALHFDVERWGQSAGFAELGGTGLMNPKYKNNPLGKIPTNGIFKVRCRRCDIPGFFMICFAVTKTEFTLE